MLQLPETRARLEAQPELIRREVEALGAGSPVLVFIDEIQRVPAILDVLQYLLDEGKAVLAATGSSARKMRRGARNWLPGRIALESLRPLRAKECPEVSLEERLLFGGLPGVAALPDKLERAAILRAYAGLYLEEEIRQEAAVRTLPPFARFLQLAALESGGSPNLSKLAGSVGVSQPTIRAYYQILEDSLVALRVPAFGRSRADVTRHARYFLFDTGVRNAAAGLGHDAGLLPLQAGVLLEHVVLNELLSSGPPDARISYWRTRKGAEVDFVIESRGRVLAVEVKHTDRPGPADVEGLAAFRAAEGCDSAFLLCRIARPQKFPGATALPWDSVDSIWGNG